MWPPPWRFADNWPLMWLLLMPVLLALILLLLHVLR
jgi:hypothetical protein